MVWWSINPVSEPYVRKSAANALASDPNEKFTYTEELSPTQLAELYNNAEKLGLDLNSTEEISYWEDRVTFD